MHVNRVSNICQTDLDLSNMALYYFADFFLIYTKVSKLFSMFYQQLQTSL